MFNFYGLFIALGVLTGVFVVEKLRKKTATYNLQLTTYDILLYILIPGIIGARLYHVIDYWHFYSENLAKILYVWEGGLGIFGGVIGGVIGLLAYSAVISWQEFKEEKLRNYAPLSGAEIKKLRKNFPQYLNVLISNFLNLADLAVIGLSIGQAIGRWGNYFNQELYGLPTNLFCGIYIRSENRLPGYESFTHFHPLFLYESIGCLIIFIVLLVVAHFSARLRSRNKFRYYKKHGSIFFIYLFLYSFLRFWLDFLRIENWVVRLPLTMAGIRVNQVVGLGLMLISGLAIYKKSVKIKS